MTVISIATASTTTAASSSTTFVTALTPSSAYSVRVTVLSEAIIGRLFAVAITKTCGGLAWLLKTLKDISAACVDLNGRKVEPLCNVPSSGPV